jgi:hypothetical protein
VTAPRPWLGISTRDWFINSDTPHSDGFGTARACLLIRGSGRAALSAYDLRCRVRTGSRAELGAG